MAQQLINIGAAPNDRTGDTWRNAFDKTNQNFTEVFTRLDAIELKFIASESDFEVQDATTITLEANSVYVITSSFTTTKRFICENGSSVTAFNQLGISITYTGTGNMFTGVDVNFVIADIRLFCPTAQAFSFSDSAILNVHTFFARHVDIASSAKVATFTSMASFVLCDCAAFNAADGISIVGTGWFVWRVQNTGIQMNSASGVGIDMGIATGDIIVFGPMAIGGPSGSVGISGLINSGNVTVNNLAKVDNVNFVGAITPLSGLTVDDIRWFFSLNDQIPDTMPDAMASLRGNSTETVISAANTPVKVAGTWVVERDSQWTVDTTGRLTYNGERDITVPSDIVGTTEAASGTNKDITTYLALNGSIISNSGKSNRVGGSDPRNTSVLWQLTVSTGDYLEKFIENNTDTTNLVTIDAINRAR